MRKLVDVIEDTLLVSIDSPADYSVRDIAERIDGTVKDFILRRLGVSESDELPVHQLIPDSEDIVE